MKIIIDLDDLGVNGKGEALRSLVFNQHQDGHFLFGCYETFDVNDGFIEIEPKKYKSIYDKIKPYDDFVDIKVIAYESKDIVTMWWWDGDGDLTFWIKGESHFYQNTDCKCDYEWQEIEIQEVPDDT
ncbi:MAG: hypothetical protein A2Y53_00015 [Chloroflexi bacterium RBG_16_47_49]|nr:MAG: hypothetical protein A2Y53_00015 [Chloroflexi bacterium RBG_16_47_49]